MGYKEIWDFKERGWEKIEEIGVQNGLKGSLELRKGRWGVVWTNVKYQLINLTALYKESQFINTFI